MEVKKCTKLKKQTRISCLINKKADIEIYRPFFMLLKSKIREFLFNNRYNIRTRITQIRSVNADLTDFLK
jgi:hypothetical protein